MKREREEEPAKTEPRKKQRTEYEYPLGQDYAIIGLRGNVLRLCPVEGNRYSSICPDITDIVRVKVPDNKDGVPNMKLKLSKLPGLKYTPLWLSGEKVEECTRVKDIRTRMRADACTLLEADIALRALAAVMLPVLRDIWTADVPDKVPRTSDQTIALLWSHANANIADRLSVDTVTDSVGEMEDKESEFLHDAQFRLLMAFKKHCTSPWWSWRYDIRITYERNVGYRTVSLQILKNENTRYVSLYLSDDRPLPERGEIEWQRNQKCLSFSSLSSDIVGKTTWEKGIPPLCKYFRKDCLPGGGSAHPYRTDDRGDTREFPSLQDICISQLREAPENPCIAEPWISMMLYGREDVGLTSPPP